MKHLEFIQQTFTLAQQAVKNGDHPFAALLVKEGQVVLTALNTVNSDKDFTKHAEINLLSKAASKYSCTELRETTLYTSTEPCMMCCGAIYWSGIRKIVYGGSANALQIITKDKFLTSCRDLLPQGEFEIFGPCDEDKGREIHQKFWTCLT